MTQKDMVSSVAATALMFSCISPLSNRMDSRVCRKASLCSLASPTAPRGFRQRTYRSSEAKRCPAFSKCRAFLCLSGLLVVFEFFVPGHLDGLQLAFIGGLGITGEARQFGHVAMQVSKAHCERIELREFFLEQNADVFSIVP